MPVFLPEKPHVEEPGMLQSLESQSETRLSELTPTKGKGQNREKGTQTK